MFDFLSDLFEGLMNFLIGGFDYLVLKLQEAAEWIFEYLLPFLKETIVWSFEKSIEFGSTMLSPALQAFDSLGAAGQMIIEIHGYANTFFNVPLVVSTIGMFVFWEISILVVKIGVKLFPGIY